MDKPCKIAVYIRLSVADEDTGKGKEESESVGNQRMLIHHFLDNHKELSGYPRVELIDDGFTGTNFHRPRFQEMMERVQTGEINVICVKDFSRFSRDYIETGNYLECVFPFLGVRFLSINDGYDSNDYKGTTGGLEVVMRSIIYASYSKDLSIKTTTAKLHMMKQGKYVGNYAPYGYTLHPTVRNKLAIDPEAAAVVRRIFQEALDGRRTGEIAGHLNNDAILTPGQYFRSRHPDNGKFNRMSDKAVWSARVVYDILTKYVYTGATVAHTRKFAGVGMKKSIPQKREDWIIVEGMHKAIVSREEFEQAQAVIHSRAKLAARKNHDYPLKGLVRCGNCKRVMVHRKGYFCCAYSTNAGDAGCAANEHYNESELETMVFRSINKFVSQARAADAKGKRINIKCSSVVERSRSKVKSLQSKAVQLKSGKLYCYNKYSEGAISKDEYLRRKADYDQQLAEVEEDIQREEEQMRRFEAEQTAPEMEAGPLLEAFNKAEGLTSELASTFLRAVYVYPDSRIELEWRFQDFLNSSVHS